MDRDVTFGFALPVRVQLVKQIPYSMVQPVGIASQFCLTESDERVLKDRLTHNMSHSISKPNASINKRCNMNRYPEMIYGFCLMRTIHYIVALRYDYPNERILISKNDFSDAYRRISHTTRAVAKTILVVGQRAFLCLRLSFGGAVNP